MTRPQWTLRSLLAVIALLTVSLCVAFPLVYQSGRADREQHSRIMLHSLARAEADFRSNDRDNDGQQNFWTYDVAGLFTLCPSSNRLDLPRPTVAAMIRLIEGAAAASDGSAVESDAPGCVPAVDAFGGWSPDGDYVLYALSTYASWPEPTAPYALAGGTAARGRCVNPGKFGFAAVPVGRRAGRAVTLMDETITRFNGGLDEEYRATYQVTGPRARIEFRGVIGGNVFTDQSPFPSAPGGYGWSK